MPVINVDIIWSKKNYDDIKLKEGQIIIENGEIWLKGQMTFSEWCVFSRVYPANIDFLVDFKKSLRFENANIDGKFLHLKDVGRYSYRSIRLHDGYADLSYKLSNLTYSYQCTNEDNYAILDVPFMCLTNTLIDLNHYPKDILLVKDGYDYRLCLYDDDKTMLCGNIENDEYLDTLLVHMSFYFNLLPNVFIKSINCNGRTIVKCHSHPYSFPKESLYHSELPYIVLGEKNDFNYLFSHSNWRMHDGKDKVKLKNAIYTFARCKYCDDSTQFLLLYSIFDRFVGGYNTDPYKTMKINMLRYDLDIEKIGKVVDQNLQQLNLKLERTNGKQTIVSNFCLLRHYILHFMYNGEIDEYIYHSNIIDRMRLATTIIILKELGFQEIKFYDDWNYLSVFVDPMRPRQNGS